MNHLISISIFVTALFVIVTGNAQTGLSSDNPRRIQCNKQVYIPSLYANVDDKDLEFTCIPEYNSVFGIWLSFTIEKKGMLGFDLVPDVESHDIDFTLLGGGKMVRCNSAGPNTSDQLWCAGSTGMRGQGGIISLSPGCEENGDGYVSGLPVNPGEQFLLFVHNFNDEAGFTLTFHENIINMPEILGDLVRTKVRDKCMELTMVSKELTDYTCVWSFKGIEPEWAYGPGPHFICPTAIDSFGWRMEIIHEDGCIREVDGENSTVVFDDLSTLQLWPNPAGELVNVDLRNLSIVEGRFLEVLDSKGTLLKSQKVTFSVETIDVIKMPQGLYTIRLVPDGKYGLMVKM